MSSLSPHTTLAGRWHPARSEPMKRERRARLAGAIMATPWPDKPCPWCGQTITDLLLEMVPDADQATADYRAVSYRQPGGAVTCPYCQRAVEYHPNGEDLVQSNRVSLL